MILLAAYLAPARYSAFAEYQSWMFKIATPVINKHIATRMGMSVLRICLSRPKGLIHENAIHSLALASTESMVESIRNIHAEDKIFSILI
ncbi:hypothetical protein C0X88_13200 [Escherichia coli O79]|nr:hypothetical protein [Escherichia coli O79]